jgi:hypothetical protein
MRNNKARMTRMTKEERMFHSIVAEGINLGHLPRGAVWLKWIDLQLNKTY